MKSCLTPGIAALAPYGWGVVDLQINREAIANGYFDLVRCRAVMPDGLTVNIPEIEQAPPPRPVEGHFEMADERLDVYLAVPARRAGAINYQPFGADNGQMVRYLQDAGLVPDETTGDNERQLAFARGNVRLLFRDELREGYSSIKIAELERTATGQLTLSENWVAPALSVSASAWLINMLRQLVEISHH